MLKKLSRQEFLKLATVLPGVLIPVAQDTSNFPVEIQIEDTEPFRPDGWYGALYDVESKQMHMHYVLDGVNYNEIWKHGIWVEGESGLPRVVVTNL